MKLIIDISEEAYKRCCVIANLDGSPILKAVKNGIPLPKGHGRLIDADALIHWHRFESKSDYDIANAQTIIEADKKGESE